MFQIFNKYVLPHWPTKGIALSIPDNEKVDSLSYLFRILLLAAFLICIYFLVVISTLGHAKAGQRGHMYHAVPSFGTPSFVVYGQQRYSWNAWINLSFQNNWNGQVSYHYNRPSYRPHYYQRPIYNWLYAGVQPRPNWRPHGHWNYNVYYSNPNRPAAHLRRRGIAGSFNMWIARNRGQVCRNRVVKVPYGGKMRKRRVRFCG